MTPVALKSAQIISNIFHPWAILVPVTALAAYRFCKEPFECVKWTLIAIIPAFVFPLIYAQIRAVTLSRHGQRQRISRSLVRNDPAQLLIMAFLFGVPPALIIAHLHGPRNLLVIMLGVSTVMFLISLVNLKYRASFHISMNTAMLTALCFMYGPACLLFFSLLPIIGLSRYRLGEHTPGQMIAGFAIGLIVSGTAFSYFGLNQ